MADFSEYRDIFVLIETENGQPKEVGFELLNAARPIADKKGCRLNAVVIGNRVEDAARDAISYGADSAYLIEGAEFETYATDAFARALIEFVQTYRPETLMIGATANGRDMAPRVSCHLKTGLTADCTGISVDEATGLIAWTRPTFGGNLMATILCPDSRPQMGTVRPGVFRKGAYDPARTGEIVRTSITVPASEIRTRVIERVRNAVESARLEDAEIIVAGGRGVGSKENFSLICQLADALGASVGCSRPVAEMGWLTSDRQIGQSGKTVSPRVYFAIGISGAIQHVAGIGGADTVIAVNSDPEAPIFAAANYGIVGNLNEVVPQLIHEFKKARGE